MLIPAYFQFFSAIWAVYIASKAIYYHRRNLKGSPSNLCVFVKDWCLRKTTRFFFFLFQLPQTQTTLLATITAHRHRRMSREIPTESFQIIATLTPFPNLWNVTSFYNRYQHPSPFYWAPFSPSTVLKLARQTLYTHPLYSLVQFSCSRFMWDFAASPKEKMRHWFHF